RQRVGCLSLLQQLLRLFDAAGDLGTIRSFRHGRSYERENSSLILGFTPLTSNALPPLRDYQSHAIRSLPTLFQWRPSFRFARNQAPVLVPFHLHRHSALDCTPSSKR